MCHDRGLVAPRPRRRGRGRVRWRRRRRRVGRGVVGLLPRPRPGPRTSDVESLARLTVMSVALDLRQLQKKSACRALLAEPTYKHATRGRSAMCDEKSVPLRHLDPVYTSKM